MLGDYPDGSFHSFQDMDGVRFGVFLLRFDPESVGFVFVADPRREIFLSAVLLPEGLVKIESVGAV